MKVTISVERSELSKLTNYEIVDEDYELRNWFKQQLCDFDKLSERDQNDILNTFDNAICDDYSGIEVNIACDSSNYEYQGCKTHDYSGHCDVLVSDWEKHASTLTCTIANVVDINKVNDDYNKYKNEEKIILVEEFLKAYDERFSNFKYDIHKNRWR